MGGDGDSHDDGGSGRVVVVVMALGPEIMNWQNETNRKTTLPEGAAGA